MKICKQCRRQLDDACFRPTKSRGTGLRRSKTGSNNLCRSCESYNVQAHNLLRKLDAGTLTNRDKLEALQKHYKQLMDAGYPPVTSAAARLMGVDAAKITISPPSDNGDLQELYEHIIKVRTRSYASFDEADKRHSELIPRLQMAGLYEDVNNMMDRWFEE